MSLDTTLIELLGAGEVFSRSVFTGNSTWSHWILTAVVACLVFFLRRLVIQIDNYDRRLGKLENRMTASETRLSQRGEY